MAKRRANAPNNIDERSTRQSAPSFDAPFSRAIAMFAVAATPLVVSLSGSDSFRLPKELLLRACGAAIASILLLGAIWSRRAILRTLDLREPQVGIAAAIVAWTVVAAVFSMQRHLSLLSVFWVASAVLVFLAIERGAGAHSMYVLLVPIVPAVLNAVVAVTQELRIWNPFIPLEMMYNAAGERTTNLRGTVGFLGNPNDIGAFLAPAFIVAIAAGVTSRRLRWFSISVAAVILGGLLAARSLTAFIAVGAAMTTLAVRSRPRVRWTVVGLLLAASIAGSMLTPVRVRIMKAKTLIVDGRFDELTSGRFIGSATAWQMFLDHPVTGVGPGAFGYEFFDYAIRVRERRPSLATSNAPTPNFGEVHDDHLQVLATTGIVGYGLMIAAIVWVGSRSFVRVDPADARASFARVAALPLAVGFAVSALAQFPLELAACVTEYAFYAAVCIGWVAASRRVS